VEPWPVQAATAAIAIASKRVLRAGSANIFNPAALALVVAAIAFGSGHAWWGALPEVSIVGVAILLAIGWVVADYVNKVPLVLAFLGTYFAAFTAVTFVGNAATVTEIFTTPDVQAVLFFALFMLDDPPTSPPRYVDQVLFALIVAVGAFLAFMLFGVQYYLFAGLLIGNAWEALRRAATRRLPRATAG
jgi:Na+-translocating ferredoxin:NAD+ oxidoreductase RnfD subunit